MVRPAGRGAERWAPAARCLACLLPLACTGARLARSIDDGATDSRHHANVPDILAQGPPPGPPPGAPPLPSADGPAWEGEGEDAEDPTDADGPPLTDADLLSANDAGGGLATAGRLALSGGRRLRAAAAAAARVPPAAEPPDAATAAANRLTAGSGEVCGEGGLCSGHGTCNLETGQCQCEALFAGPACEIEHCPGFQETGLDCNGHGICESGACQCMPGWGLLAGSTGANMCQDRVCALACDHGTCVNGTCQCLPGWKGPNCRDPQCINECSGHGTCSLPSSHSPGECICDYGWAGAGCERKGLYKLMQRCPEDCSGNGLCLNGMCACNVGFAGPSCNEVACGSAFAGPRCDLARCPGDCRGQGLCMAGQCSCWEGFEGLDCSIPTQCLEPCRRFCLPDAESSEQCIFCVGQCTTARSHSGQLGTHNPFEDLEGTL